MQRTDILTEVVQSGGLEPTAVARTRAAAAWERVRSCWLRLEGLAEQAASEIEQSERARDGLVEEHRAALDELVDVGELDVAVADQVQVAFSEAAFHVWRSNAPITCYEPVLVDYVPASSGQLARQADLLAGMGEGGDLDPEIVAQARAALERDVAFLNLSWDEKKALYDELVGAAGDTRGFPPFDELDLEVSPEAAEAARVLVDLLLGEME